MTRSKTAIYARFSSSKQREASIDDQVRRCREYASREGLNVAEHLVFKDEAVSGASITRSGFDAMMALATASPRQIDIILAEDQSRISRDIADAATVFKKLQFAGVELVCVADGINTAHRGSKLAYTMKSLMSDLYLDDLRDKTLRGLEGRALAGFSTGSLPYGYRSSAVASQDGREIGKRIEVAEEAAAVVRGIFADYLAGHSLNTLAHGLNAKGARAPRAGSRHRRQGWVASTIRSILHNEKYAGEWRYKERQWLKEPGTNTRRPRFRPPGEVIRQERPDLRIVDAETWDETQRRLRAVRAYYTRREDGAPKGRGAPSKNSAYPFSGLLACGACGAAMVVYGGGQGSRRYRCGDNVKRGTCTNVLSVREEELRAKLLTALREHFTAPWAIAHVRERIAEVLGQTELLREQEMVERRGRLDRTTQRIAGLVRFIADGDESQAVRDTLRDLEAQAKAERSAIEALEASAEQPIVLPSPREIEAHVFALERQLARDVRSGREALKELFKDGEIRLVPDEAGGAYVARSSLLPLALFAANFPRTHEEGERTSASKVSPGRRYTELVAGARYARRISAVVMPFEAGPFA